MEIPGVSSLCQRIADGDREAWTRVVDRHAQMVWSIARSYRLDDAAVADVSQTVWLRLIEHAGSIRDENALPGWLATCTRREALRTIRHARREFAGELDDGADPTVAHFSERLEADDRRRTMLVAFNRLTETCQQLLRLLALDPPPDYATVAEALGRPIGSIGPTRQRCLARLRALVGEIDPDLLEAS
jgi:RNA polymerase sigma factor (sigma-70 family)